MAVSGGSTVPTRNHNPLTGREIICEWNKIKTSQKETNMGVAQLLNLNVKIYLVKIGSQIEDIDTFNCVKFVVF